MSKMLEALRQMEGGLRTASSADAAKTEGEERSVSHTESWSPQTVVYRRDPPRGDSPQELLSQLTPEAPMSALERDVIENMQCVEIRQQILQLTEKIEKAAAGEPAALSLHACSGEDGSASLVLQLAMALAGRCRSPVIVVDADTQGQELTHALQARGESGLIEIFNGVHRWRQVTRPLALPGVELLPAGRGVLASEGTGTMRLGRLVERMRSESPFVLVYGGGNAGQFMQFQPSNFLASYLVLQLGQSTPQAARTAIDKLHSSEFQISGCVIAGAA